MKIIKNIFKIIALALLITSVQQSNVQAMDYLRQAKEYVINHKEALSACTIPPAVLTYLAKYGIPHIVKNNTGSIVTCGGLLFLVLMLGIEHIVNNRNLATTQSTVRKTQRKAGG